MRKALRTRKVKNLDKKNHFGKLTEQKPSGSAAAQMIHKAYQSYTVDEYLKNRGVTNIGASTED